jgi:hypothetical protein
VSSREVAVVLVRAAGEVSSPIRGVLNVPSARYGVRVRRLVLGLWWGSWRKVLVGQHDGELTSAEAHALADQALEHGWVECYGGFAEPLIGKQEE